MFAKPRVKKSILPPPNKKRKANPAIEEISFDFDAREDFLTGFHKRKLQRVKHAQEEAAKKAREEKIETRKQIRDERKRGVEEHVATVKRMLRESGAVTDMPSDEEPDDEQLEEWDGSPDRPDVELIDHEEEYIDEDRFTTVTVESVAVTREGFSKPTLDEDVDETPREGVEEKPGSPQDTDKRNLPPKKKKKKFRYESKIERSLSNHKNKARHQAKRRD